jgi:FkbM family methyltransferase
MTGARLIRSLVPRGLRNWLRNPRLTLRRALDEARYLLGNVDEGEPIPGWRVRCHPSVWREAYSAHVTDPAQARELAAFARAARPGMVLFDLGAHYGAFSLAALHFGGPSAFAVAVDPSPAAIRMLTRQARLNDVADRLLVIRAGAAEREGEIALVAAGVIAAGYYVPPSAHHTAGERTRVEAVSVDGLCRRVGRHPTHLKIDVEGAEAAVLRGARRTLTSPAPPLVFLELHSAIIRDRGGDPREPLDLLHDAGYELVGWDGAPRTAAELISADVARFFARSREDAPPIDGLPPSPPYRKP